MSKLELTGEIVHIGEVETLPTGNTEKRIFVIEIEPGQYSQQIGFELFKDKVKLINSFEVGQTVTVSFNIRGREWKGKYYTNLQAWKIAASTQYTTSPQVGVAQEVVAPEDKLPDEPDDLPF